MVSPGEAHAGAKQRLGDGQGVAVERGLFQKAAGLANLLLGRFALGQQFGEMVFVGRAQHAHSDLVQVMH